MYKSYSVDDGFGNTISAGLPAHLARGCAQKAADRLGRSVWLRDGSEGDGAYGEDDIGEEFTPSMDPVSVSDDEIETLRAEAGASGDAVQVGLCDLVLGREAPTGTVIDRNGRDAEPEDARAVARIECERMIRGAQRVTTEENIMNDNQNQSQNPKYIAAHRLAFQTTEAPRILHVGDHVWIIDHFYPGLVARFDDRGRAVVQTWWGVDEPDELEYTPLEYKQLRVDANEATREFWPAPKG